MRWSAAVFCVILLARASAWAQQDDLRRAQVEAAAADAVSSLREQVLRSAISNNLSVRGFLARTDGRAELDRTLQRSSRQIGGPRWIDDQTCQVQMEISGQSLAQTLVQLAAANPSRSPLTPQVLQSKLHDWDRRTFAATGASVGANRAELLRPVQAAGPWASVSDDARRQAVAAARISAVQHVLDSLGPIELTPGSTLGDALREETVRRAVSAWLATRPVTRMEYRDDYQVEVTLAAPAPELFGVLQTAVQQAKDVPQPRDWTGVRKQVLGRVAAAVGRGAVPAAAVGPQPVEQPAQQALPAVRIPPEPPEWSYQQIDAEGTAPHTAGGSRLKAARAAEANATDRLRARVEALPLSPSLTLAAAARQDPRVREALKQAMARARIYRADYDPAAGTVTIRVSLDLRDLWDELRSLP